MATSNKPPKTKSVARAAQTALNQDQKRRKSEGLSGATADSFVNFAQNLGVGSDNPMTGSTYGFNPVTRNRTLLEWVHRGSWLGGVAIDVVADDMTRAGVDIMAQALDPDQISQIEESITSLGVWNAVNDTIKWARLYGGCIAVMLIDGQDMSTPLRLNTIRKGQFFGLMALDRWMVNPSLNNLVTQFGPDLGLPKFYTVTAQAPALSGVTIHHSRVIRLEGIRLPYWQRLMENLWGLSILERLYDRMVAFDSASTGAAQLVYKSYMRTYKIKGMREVIAQGGDALNGLVKYVDMMRRFQGIEGITIMDGEDEFQGDSHGAFSGLSDDLQQFGQQIAGALGIPLLRLFGQSPAGFSTGDTDLQNYYDTIKQAQEKDLKVGMTKVYRVAAMSEGIDVSDEFSIAFRSLWEMNAKDKAEVAESVGRTVLAAEETGAIDRATVLKELKQASKLTGVFTTITDEMIDEAETEGPPLPEDDPAQGGSGSEPAAAAPAPNAPSVQSPAATGADPAVATPQGNEEERTNITVRI